MADSDFPGPGGTLEPTPMRGPAMTWTPDIRGDETDPLRPAVAQAGRLGVDVLGVVPVLHGRGPGEPPVTSGCEECRHFYSGGSTAKHDLELGCAPDCPCQHDHPAASGTPDLMAALRASVEEASRRRTQPSGDRVPPVTDGPTRVSSYLGPTMELDAVWAVVREVLPEAIGRNTLPEIVAGIAAQRDTQHELKDHLADTARSLTARLESTCSELEVIQVRLRRATDALAELVRLKDGPRDEAYRTAKESAWLTARVLLPGEFQRIQSEMRRVGYGQLGGDDRAWVDRYREVHGQNG